MTKSQISNARRIYSEMFGTDMDREDIAAISKLMDVEDVNDACEAGDISNGVNDACEMAMGA